MSTDTYAKIPFEPINQPPSPQAGVRKRRFREPWRNPPRPPKKKKEQAGLRERMARCKGWEDMRPDLHPYLTIEDKQEWFKQIDKKIPCKSCTTPAIAFTHMCAYHTVYHRAVGRQRRGIIPTPIRCKGCGIEFTPTNGNQKYCRKLCQQRTAMEVNLYSTKLALGEAGYRERNDILREHGYKCACCQEKEFGTVNEKGNVALPRFREVEGELAKKLGTYLAPFCEPCSRTLSILITLKGTWGWEKMKEMADNALPLKSNYLN